MIEGEGVPVGESLDEHDVKDRDERAEEAGGLIRSTLCEERLVKSAIWASE